MKRICILCLILLCISSSSWAGYKSFNSFSSFIDWMFGKNSKTSVEWVDYTSTLTASPSSVAFGNVTTNTTRTQVVTWSNSGTGVSEAIEQTVANVSGTGFSLSSPGTCGANPFDIAAGGSCTSTVAYNPMVAGAATGTLTATWPNRDPVVVNLSGTGVGAPVPYSYVGSIASAITTALSTSVTYSATTGNMLVVGSRNAGTSTSTSISGGCATSWTEITHFNDESVTRAYTWYCSNATGGSQNITVTGTTSASISLILAEFSGGSKVLDAFGSRAATSTTPYAVVTPTVDDTLIVAIAEIPGSDVTWTAGADYTMPTTSVKMAIEYRSLSGGAGVAQSPGFTISATRNYGVTAASFK